MTTPSPGTYMVTGGAGFIGSALVRQLIAETDARVVVLDKLTYAGNLDSLESVADNPRYHFEKGDICDARVVRDLFARTKPDIVFILRRKPMSTAQSTPRQCSWRPISKAPM